MSKFQPGQPKPPSSGSKPGQKYRKTIEREEAGPKLRAEINAVSKKYVGKSMTAEEIMDDMGFEPIVEAIILSQQPTVKESDRIKLLEMLMSTKHAKKKAVENTGEVPTHTVKVLMPGMPGYDDDDIIDVEVKPLIEYDDVALVEASEGDPQDDAS